MLISLCFDFGFLYPNGFVDFDSEEVQTNHRNRVHQFLCPLLGDTIETFYKHDDWRYYVWFVNGKETLFEKMYSEFKEREKK